MGSEMCIRDSTGRPESGYVSLDWKTASESGNDYFILERSADGISYTALGFVPGNGNTSTVSSYSYIDTDPLQGISYYRLRQVDYNGNSDFSPIVPVRIGVGASVISLYPNPVRDKAWLMLQSEETCIAALEIFDATGKLALSQSLELVKGSNGLQLDLGHLPAGIYHARLGTDTFRIVKQ